MEKNKLEKNKEYGWIVSESILLELDIILSVINGYINPDYFEDLSDLMKKIPAELLKELRGLLPGNRQLLFCLSKLAILNDAIFESDYKKASLSVRKMSITEAIDILTERMKPFSILPDTKLDPLRLFIDFMVRIELYSDKRTGFSSHESVTKKNVTDTMLFCSKIIKGGELEYDFWHYLDRFYYEVYLPWRNETSHIIKKQKDKAIKILGTAESHDSYPDHDSLISINPLFHNPGLKNGLSKLKSKLHFVTTPLDYFDFAHAEPGYGLFTLTESAWKHEKWVTRIDEISKMTKAISDTTRLSILRMVRKTGKYTTELAAIMNVSRPTVSEHCKILRNAGLIETYQDGRKSYHQLKPKCVKKLFHDLEGFLDIQDVEE